LWLEFQQKYYAQFMTSNAKRGDWKNRILGESIIRRVTLGKMKKRM